MSRIYQLYQKKPVKVAALQWTGDNTDEIIEFVGISKCTLDTEGDEKKLIIATLEGDHHASINDYILRGVKGEYYPCKPDIFSETYEKTIEMVYLL